MIKRRSKVAAAALLLALLLPTASSATGWPVVDLLALVQRLIQIYNQGKQIVNDGKTIVNQAQQIKLQAKTLESFVDGGNFSDLNGLIGQVDQIFNTAESATDNLGYLKINVDNIFSETFPGYQPPVFSPNADYQVRVDRAHETLALIMRALNRLTWNNTHSKIALAQMIEDSRSADSPLEEAEAGNMIATLQTTELQKGLQAQLLTANAVTVGVGLVLQQQATADRARADWLDSSDVSAIPSPQATGGFTGLPSSIQASSLF